MTARPSSVAFGLYCGATIWLLILIGCQVYVEWLQALQSHKYSALRRYTPVSCVPDPLNHGKIVHVDCPVENEMTFYAPKRYSWNLGTVNGLFFDTKVEMYQWGHSHSTLGLRPTRRWSESREDRWSSGFITPSENPEYWPYIEGQGRQFPSKFYAGGFEIDRAVISTFKELKRVPLKRDDSYTPSPVRPPQSLSSRNTHVVSDYLYSGDELSPQIGDVRISFYTSAATHVSALGRQLCLRGKCYIVPASEPFTVFDAESAGWARRDSEIDPDDNFANAINKAKSLVDLAHRRSRSFWERSPGIQNLSEEVIIVREGDHSGYRLLHDTISGGSKPRSRRWFLRLLVFMTATVVGAYSFAIFRPKRGFPDDMPSHVQLMWLGIGGGGAALFLTCTLSAIVRISADPVVGIVLVVLGMAGLVLAFYVGENVLEQIDNLPNYNYAKLSPEPVHGAVLPPYHPRTSYQSFNSSSHSNFVPVQEEKSESSYYSPL